MEKWLLSALLLVCMCALATCNTDVLEHGPAGEADSFDIIRAPIDQCVGDEVRFIAVGDTGYGNEKAFAMGKAMAAHCAKRGCNFIMLLGDIIYPEGASSGTDSDWNKKFEEPFGKIIPVPFHMVMGNHDYGGEHPDAHPGKAKPYKDYAALHPETFHFSSTSYSFSPVDSEQVVEFFAVDTPQFASGLIKHQVLELAPKIALSKARWKIMFGHHPMVSNGEHDDTEPGVAEGYNALVCDWKIHALITGHDHNMQWLKENKACPNVELIVSGAGSSTVPLHAPTATFVKAPFRFENDTTPGFFYGKISCDTFWGEFRDVNGTLLYSRYLKQQ